MEFIQIQSTKKECHPGPKDPKSNKILEIGTVINFLSLFSLIWFLEGKIWKAIKAFVSAGRLYLEKSRYSQRAVLLTNPMDPSVFENEVEYTGLREQYLQTFLNFNFAPLSKTQWKRWRKMPTVCFLSTC